MIIIALQVSHVMEENVLTNVEVLSVYLKVDVLMGCVSLHALILADLVHIVWITSVSLSLIIVIAKEIVKEHKYAT